MSKSTTDLKSMVRLGGGISIDASNYSTTDLQSFARLSPGKIIFEF